MLILIDTEMIGQTISHYTVLEKLGEGGMGVVYKAEDTRLKRTVALKFLPAHLSASDQDKARFMQEAQAAAALNHPNICTIYGIEEHDRQMFIAMEFVDGQTLREKQSTIGFKQAIDIGIQIADGLAAAHEKGIVHRDIKPENIMIRRDGIAQIMDFGLAKLRESGSKVTRLTKAGSTVGTAGYMSPEQVQGQDTDHRSDIFSFGVLLYELLTGQLPFKGVHETALAYEIVNVDPAPMSTIRPEIDPSLDAVVFECLEKDINERAQSIKQVSVDLKKYKRESSRQRMSRVTAARPAMNVPRSSGAIESAGSPRKRNVWSILSGVLAVAVVVLMWNLWKKTDIASRPVLRASILFSADELPSGAGIDVSPDGRYLVYSGTSGQLFLRRMDESKSQPIPGAFGGRPKFSPDGRWVVYYDGKNISKVSLTGSARDVVCASQSFVPGLWWTPDDKILFGTYSGGLAEVPVAGGTPTAVTSLDSMAGEISHRFPQLLPDGKSVIYTAKTKDMASFDEALIVAQRLSNGERKVLVKGGFHGRYLPGGYLIYLRGKTIFAVRFDAERLEVTGTPVPVEEGGILDNVSTECLGISADGIAVFSPASAYRDLNGVSIGWMDRAGGTHPLFDTLRFYNTAALSPDGQKIAVGISSANDDIWVYDIPRGLLSRLTFGWGNNNLPLWSSDGKYVMYSAEKGQIANLYRKPWDGSGSEERLTVSANPQSPVDRTSDGRYLSFNEKGDIWILPLDSSGSGPGRPYPLIQTPALESGGYFSPDGKWMAYNSDESGKQELYVVSFPKPGRKQQISNGGGFGGGFSRDGKEFFYGNGPSMMVVDVKPGGTFDFSVPRKLCAVPPLVNPTAIFPDGKRFLVLINKPNLDSLTQLNVVSEWFEVVKSKTQAP